MTVVRTSSFKKLQSKNHTTNCGLMNAKQEKLALVSCMCHILTKFFFLLVSQVSCYFTTCFWAKFSIRTFYCAKEFALRKSVSNMRPCLYDESLSLPCVHVYTMSTCQLHDYTRSLGQCHMCCQYQEVKVKKYLKVQDVPKGFIGTKRTKRYLKFQGVPNGPEGT